MNCCQLKKGRFESQQWAIQVPLWSNFLPLDFLDVSHRILWKNENAVYRLQIHTCISSGDIQVWNNVHNYANKMTDDVIHSTQYYIMCINRAILANLQRRSLKLGRLTFSSPEPRILWLRMTRGSGKTLQEFSQNMAIWTSRRMLLEQTGD